jgi:hypothetical protein
VSFFPQGVPNFLKRADPSPYLLAFDLPFLQPHFILNHVVDGAIGSIFTTSSGYILKVTGLEDYQKLRKEYMIYNTLGSRQVAHLAPLCFGFFTDDLVLALVLSHEGHSFNNFDSLTISERCVLPFNDWKL